MFLTDTDYQSHQRDFDMSVLTNSNNATIRNFAELATIEEIKSYLRRRFDVDLIFIDITVWDGASTYNEDDYVTHNGSIYKALQASTNEDPSAPASTFWELGDPRDPFLVMTAIDMTVYHLYAKIPKRTTPEDVMIRYDSAIDWLNGVTEGKFEPDYPKLEVDGLPTGNQVRWGSSTKLNHRF